MKNSTKTIVTALLATVIGAGGMAAVVYAESLEEQQETESLQSLAKITLEQAKQAAEEAVGGTASSVELEVEDGSLVYEVEIGQTEVIVDAGNGEVLYTESAVHRRETTVPALTAFRGQKMKLLKLLDPKAAFKFPMLMTKRIPA